MQNGLSPEAAELLKTELTAPPSTSTRQCLPGGQTLPVSAAYLPIGPQPILDHVRIKLDRRAILSNIAFRSKRQTHLTRFLPRERTVKEPYFTPGRN